MSAEIIAVGDAALMLTTPLARELMNDLNLRPMVGVTECVPALGVLTVLFDPLKLRPEALASALQVRLAQLVSAPPDKRHRVIIPVQFIGPDLEWCANHAGLSVAQFITTLCDTPLEVAFLGFTAGFAFLTGLPSTLMMPRLASPRQNVTAGSVALGGPWAGIYPSATAGGWRIVGQTSVQPFKLGRNPQIIWQAGDQVHFAVQEAELGTP